MDSSALVAITIAVYEANGVPEKLFIFINAL